MNNCVNNTAILASSNIKSINIKSCPLCNFCNKHKINRYKYTYIYKNKYS